MILPPVWLAKTVSFLLRFLNLGAGSTWPGHLMLLLNPSFLRQFQKNFAGKIIVIAGTNGKTTTSKIIRTILEENRQKVIHNEAGANLLNGVASAIIQGVPLRGVWPNVAIFEVDENTLSLLFRELTPDILVVLNLFRDQLDRYGEVDSIALKWHEALQSLPRTAKVFLNADDPYVTFLGKHLRAQVSYFGLENENLYLAKPSHAMDALYCLGCGKKLIFEGIYFAHLGKWKCENCGFVRPRPDFSLTKKLLPGIYNLYNSQAALLIAKTLGIEREIQKRALKRFLPAFGRQEEFKMNGRKIKIFLAKNPAGFNESIRTIKELGGQYFLLVLNDRIPDGRDVSWIWDVDFEELVKSKISIIISGDRAYDMGLRIKYTIQNYSSKYKIVENLREAINQAVSGVSTGETLYILPTYSAMLEVRKILTGRKIL